MKKIFCMLFATAALSALAQDVENNNLSIEEPEFINSYCILINDSTYDLLPKESGIVGKHQNKVGKWAKIASGIANVASSVGVVGIGVSGSTAGKIASLRTVTSASGVADAADAINGLAGSVGMDIIFKGKASPYVFSPDSSDVRFLIMAENNKYNPLDCYRIVRFKVTKKARRIQWLEFQPALLGSDETSKAGYIPFTGHKYGNQSYLLTVPVSELTPGEYGIFYMSIATATDVPVGTFSIQ